MVLNPDSDSDGKPDYLDPDSDSDGIPDYLDPDAIATGGVTTWCPPLGPGALFTRFGVGERLLLRRPPHAADSMAAVAKSQSSARDGRAIYHAEGASQRSVCVLGSGSFGRAI